MSKLDPNQPCFAIINLDSAHFISYLLSLIILLDFMRVELPFCGGDGGPILLAFELRPGAAGCSFPETKMRLAAATLTTQHKAAQRMEHWKLIFPFPGYNERREKSKVGVKSEGIRGEKRAKTAT